MAERPVVHAINHCLEVNSGVDGPNGMPAELILLTDKLPDGVSIKDVEKDLATLKKQISRLDLPISIIDNDLAELLL